MWQAEADEELTLSASPATAVGEQTLTLANRRYSTVVESQDFGHNARLWGVKITPYTPKSSAKKYRDITFHIVIHTVV